MWSLGLKIYVFLAEKEKNPHYAYANKVTL